MTDKANAVAAQLLDAHVAFTLDQLLGDELPAQLADWVDYLLEKARKLKLKDVVTPSMIKATAHKYAIHMEPGPGLPELVAQVARAVYNHPGHEQALLKDLLGDNDFQDIVNKALDLEKAREQIVHEAVRNPVYTDLISDVLYHGIRDFMANNPLTKKIPGAQSMMKLGKSMMDKATPNIEETILKYIRKNLNASLRQSEQFLNRSLTREKMTGIASDIWDGIKHEPVARFRDYIGEEDVEDFFVIGYEYWRGFRNSEYYRSMIDAGVDLFFDVYGKHSLHHILDELGVTRDMLLDDAEHYAGHVLKALHKKGFLEEAVRRQLEPFYSAPATVAILSGA